MKRKNLILTIIAAGLMVLAGCEKKPGTEKPDPKPDPEETEDIVVVDGKVRFYLSVDGNAASLKMGAKKHSWTTKDKIRVNNSQYSVQQDADKRYYIDANAADDNVYKTAFYESSKYFPASCFTGVIIPHAQCYKAGGNPLAGYPMYAVYSKTTGNKLIFKDGYAVLALTLKGTASISSIKVEDAAGGNMGGGFNFDESKTALVAQPKGVDFITLNCGGEGSGVGLSSTGTIFHIVIPARNYASGLQLTVCDRDHLAMFHKTAAVNIAPNSVHEVPLDYAPATDLCFYEGFDTFVWGGDIMAGEGSPAYSPSDAAIAIGGGTDYTGYEEALTAVPYSNPGSGYMQPDTWDSSKDVAANHQMSTSYLKSRNMYDWRYLFRCQEYQGCMAIGAAANTRGIMQTPGMSAIKKLGTVEISFKFCFQAGITDDLLCNVVSGGVITACKLNGSDVPLTAANSGYESNAAVMKLMRTQVQIPASAAAAKTWNTVTLTVQNANTATALYLASLLSTAGVHGIYVDDIKVTKVADNTLGPNNLRVLFWNIQNGMWSDQGNNYDNFVKWVKVYDPDICIWCEAQTIYKTGTSSAMAAGDRYLTNNWGALAARYGHSYWTKSGHRDNYPQVITAKMPITKILDITNGPTVTVSHGACQAKVTVNGKDIHIVTLHMWPQAYGFGVPAAEQAASAAAFEGDKYREKEIIDILNLTINAASQAGVTNWIMAGDFNSRSPVDNWYHNWSDNDTRFLVHKYIRGNTQMKDVIGDRYPGCFFTSTGGNSRIDYIYASPAMYALIDNSISVVDAYAAPVPDLQVAFYHPSDHRPVLVDFTIN